jgi:ABC-2 type transport system permease protein
VSHVLLIARTELLRRLRSRSALVVAFLAPLALGVVFGVLIAGTNTSKFTIGVVDADRSQLSQRFVDGLLHGDASSTSQSSQPPRPRGSRNSVRFRSLATTGSARHAVDTGDVDAALVVPAGFGVAAASGHPAELLVLRKASRPVSGQVGQAVAGGLASGIDRVDLSIATLAAVRPGVPTAATIAAAQQVVAPITTTDVAMGAHEVSAVAFYGAAMAIVFLFFTVSFAPRSLLAEQRDGTLGRILATPTSLDGVIAGKVLAVCELAVAGFVVVWLVTSAGFGAGWGDPLAVLVLIVATVAALGGVSTFVCSLARTEQQADSYASVVTFVLALLGGNFIGPGQAPTLLRRLALFTPNGWSLRAFTDVSADAAGVGRVLVPVLVLLGFAVGFGSVGLLRVRRGLSR